MGEMRDVSTNGLWRRFTFILIMTVLLAGATLISIGITTTSPKNSKELDSAFLRIAKSAESREFIGTYIVQWVQKGGIVSWCLKFSWIEKGRLECTPPAPFYPSNGYAYQLLPFVQTTLLSQVENFLSGQPKRSPPVVVERSSEFGTLHCLLQTSGVPHLKTCVNRAGFIVSSNYRRGKYWYSTILESLGRRLAASEFVTLQAPSRNVPLPPA